LDVAKLRDNWLSKQTACDTPAGLNDLVSAEELAQLEVMEQSGVDYSDFWAAIDEIWQAVPLADWETIPHDLSTNLDHYLYGSPKQAV
jgi:hypothetical protein